MLNQNDERKSHNSDFDFLSDDFDLTFFLLAEMGFHTLY